MAIRAAFQRVEVHWVDSASTKGWHDMDTLDEQTGVIHLVSTGYLVKMDDKEVVIVQTHHDKKTQPEVQDRWAEGLAIPAKCVTKVKVF